MLFSDESEVLPWGDVFHEGNIPGMKGPWPWVPVPGSREILHPLCSFCFSSAPYEVRRREPLNTRFVKKLTVDPEGDTPGRIQWPEARDPIPCGGIECKRVMLRPKCT